MSHLRLVGTWEQTPYVTKRLMFRAYLELQCQLEVEFAINTTGEKNSDCLLASVRKCIFRVSLGLV